MEIVIIGSGNAATVLGRQLKAAGHTIAEVCGRNRDAVTTLAKELGASSCFDMQQIKPNAGFYLVAIADNALNGIEKVLQLPGRLVAHTAGSVSKDVLKKVSDTYGVFYPLQSLRKEMAEAPPIPLFIDAGDETSRHKLHVLAASVSNMVTDAGDEQRRQLHLAAVLVNNFTNHLYVLAASYCARHQLDFKLLLPLMTETVNRLQEHSPREVQTGPAARNDVVTIQRHLDMLKDDPALRHLYEWMSEDIVSRQS